MTNQELLELETEGVENERKFGTRESENLGKRIELIVEELSKAHFEIYRRRAFQALESKNSSKLRSKNEENSKYKSLIQRIDNSFLKEEKNYRLISFIDPKNELKPNKKPQVTNREQSVLNFALNEVRLNSRLERFRQRLKVLETKGDAESLEAILSATHNISVEYKDEAEDFLLAFDSVSEKDQVEFAFATDNMYENRLRKFRGNPLLQMGIHSRIPKISDSSRINLWEDDDSFNEPSYINLAINLFNREIYSGSKFINENRIRGENLEELLYIRENENDILGNGWNDRFYNIGSASSDLESNIGFGLASKSVSEKDILPGRNTNKSSDSLFFDNVRNVYLNLGEAVGSKWLKQISSLFVENNEEGRDFALKSFPTLLTYHQILGWDFENFVRDYRSIGKSLFDMNDLTNKFFGLSKERKNKLIRHLIDTKDQTSITVLKLGIIPASSLVENLLPDEISPKDLVDSLRRTVGLYNTVSVGNIDNRFVNNRLSRAKKAGSFEEYKRTLQTIEEQAREYIEFAKEQRKDTSVNLGFDDFKSQETLELYQFFLGKNFSQFRRDFESTGTEFLKLPDISKKYKSFLDDERLKSVLNYVAKQRNRDLINDLVKLAPENYVCNTLSKLGNAGKEQIVKTLRELNSTYDFLNNVGATEILTKRLNSLSDAAGGDEVFEAIKGARRECYSAVTGGAEVPKDLEHMIDNLVVGYYKNSGSAQGVNIQPTLKFIVSTYLDKGAQKTYQIIRNLKPNKKLRKHLKRKGIKIDEFESGITRKYHVSTDEESINRLKEKINSEVTQVWDRLSILYTPKDEETDEGEETEEIKEVKERRNQLRDQIEKLRQGNLREQIEGAEKFIGVYEFDEETKPLKLEVKGHIQKARSLTGTIKEMDTDATFYVSKDPLESLHMGQYFGSCLSLAKNHGGCNSWGSVVQTMDSNKNVIYAKSEDGRYIGRNRTALTDQGILCTRFYQNGDMNLNESWISYLRDFADHVEQDVMIPTKFSTESMSKILERMVQEGIAKKENREVRIAPAYHSAFYDDGIGSKKLFMGDIQINTEVYVLKPRVEK